MSYGILRVAIPVLKAVNPISFDISLKKNFLSISLAISGSYTMVVLPEPETPTTKKDSSLLLSGIIISSPDSELLHKYTSHEYLPVSFGLPAKLIPP